MMNSPIKVKRVTESKIRGHITTCKNNTTEKVPTKLKKAIIACGRGDTIITEKSVDVEIRLQLFDALIETISIYFLHVVPIRGGNLSKLRIRYPECVRIIPCSFL